MEFPHARWRLIESAPRPGPWNMGVDEAVLEAVGAGHSPPVLRLYAWEPPCLSLGTSQPLADVDLERLAARGWSIVRRPTGGSAILHTDEITYAVIAPIDDPRIVGGVLDSYRRLAQGLLHTLSLLQAPVHVHEKSVSRAERRPPVCFEVPSNYEITVAGKKLIGSAQVRRRKAVLQHGTLPLHGDLKRITEALQFASESDREAAGDRLLEKATTLADVLDPAPGWQEAASAFRRGFQEALQITLDEGPLTAEEEARALELVEQKYGHPDWLGRH